MDSALAKLADLLPAAFRPFEGTEYPMPVSQAMLGEMPDVAELKKWLAEAAEGELKNMCEPAAVAAEVIESAAADRDEFFIKDGKVRGYVFSGAKWKAGWVLLAGAGVTDELAARLKGSDYMIFSADHDEQRQVALPPRETGAVYFLQLMARYAMIWGLIPPGDDHEMGHFLERDMPGAMVVLGDVSPVEGLVLLSIMKMGCPAVVGPEFPYDIGPRAVAKTDDEVVEALSSFPNMRVQVVDGEEVSLPDPADPAHAKEEVVPARTVTGLLQLRPGEVEESVDATGDESADAVAVIIEVKDDKLDLPISAHLEAQAAGMGSYLPGIKTRRSDDGDYAIELADGVELDGELLGDVILAGLKREYPKLGATRVRVAFGKDAVDAERPACETFNAERDEAILAESESTVDEFHLCIDCQPFSQSHVCVITPDRPPMCGRGRSAIKSCALWGANYSPWTRRDVGGGDLQRTIAKGDAIDEAAGEWAGLNAAVKEFSGGSVERVMIHSVLEAPHTSCGCFGALAFRITGTDHIGVMDRGYKGVAPGELTWSILANRAGGKQNPGVTGVHLSYLKSPKAFGGEGGFGALKWITKRCADFIGDDMPPGCRIATELDATTTEGLEAFMAKG